MEAELTIKLRELADLNARIDSVRADRDMWRHRAITAERQPVKSCNCDCAISDISRKCNELRAELSNARAHAVNALTCTIEQSAEIKGLNAIGVADKAEIARLNACMDERRAETLAAQAERDDAIADAASQIAALRCEIDSWNSWKGMILHETLTVEDLQSALDAKVATIQDLERELAAVRAERKADETAYFSTFPCHCGDATAKGHHSVQYCSQVQV